MVAPVQIIANKMLLAINALSPADVHLIEGARGENVPTPHQVGGNQKR